MEPYILFLVLAAVTIFSPGPGVLLTITNSIRFGFTSAVGGILGIACGTFAVAGISATSLGLLLIASSLAFTMMKYIGAAYLIYLGIKMWRSATPAMGVEKTGPAKKGRRFFEGITIQLTNPKAVFFFMSVFPQFVDYSTADVVGQFSSLVLTYTILVLLIHIGYAFLAKSIRHWLVTPEATRVVNRAGGATFVCFGLSLAVASR